VAFSPGPNFGVGYSSYMRINFATSAELVTEAVDRMALALGR
jgi:bifunctional pyridoxal-dependent enzyme with beta-cystathionase and maltose regulon repressor activities